MKYAILGPKDNSSLNCPQKTEPVNPIILEIALQRDLVTKVNAVTWRLHTLSKEALFCAIQMIRILTQEQIFSPLKEIF